MRPARLPSMIAFLGMLLAGCSARTEQAASVNSLEAYASAPGVSALAPAVPEEASRHRPAALVRLPAALATPGKIDGWRDTGSKSQVIALGGRTGTRGEIRLEIGRSSVLAKPTEAMIRSEIAAAFPGQSARIVTTPRHNQFGPYGLAVVAGPGELRCVYVWQWLSGTDARIQQRLGKGDAVWRLRLCREDMPLDTIAAALDQLDLGAVQPQPRRRVSQLGDGRIERAPRQRRLVAEEQVSAVPGRYLAPVTAPMSATVAGPAYARLDPTLPVEAYRGPTHRLPGAPGAVASRPIVPAATP